MREQIKTETETHSTGYSSYLLALAYAMGGSLYDLLVWWGFLPLGGECACRREFASWLELKPGFRVASLCSGTGSMENAMLAEVPELQIVGVDLGAGQIARARRKNSDKRITYRIGDATHTALPSACFDRVLITLALHEMRRPTRLALLREARRLCTPQGRVLVIEHGRPATLASRLLRALWWFFWIPGNPEVTTTRDLQKHGLDNEMVECGLSLLKRRTTQPDWIEAYLASPERGLVAAGAKYPYFPKG